MKIRGTMFTPKKYVKEYRVNASKKATAKTTPKTYLFNEGRNVFKPGTYGTIYAKSTNEFVLKTKESTNPIRRKYSFTCEKGERADGVIYMGLEYEFHTNKYLFSEHIQNNLKILDYAEFTRENDVEMVTVPCSLMRHKKLLNSLWFNNKEFVDCLSFRSDGVHIHTSLISFKENSYINMMTLLSIPDNYAFFNSMAGRSYTSNRYCPPDRGTYVGLPSSIQLNSKYRAVTVNNNTTVELRIFKAVKNKAKLFSYLELNELMVRYVNSVGVSFQNDQVKLREIFNYKNFILFVRKCHEKHPERYENIMYRIDKYLKQHNIVV